jgi:hypothetical protein
MPNWIGFPYATDWTQHGPDIMSGPIQAGCSLVGLDVRPVHNHCPNAGSAHGGMVSLVLSGKKICISPSLQLASCNPSRENMKMQSISRVLVLT